MRITAYMLNSKLLLIAKENAPVRKLTDKIESVKGVKQVKRG